MRPISDFVGLINRHVGELVKFGLWSFKVMKASRLAIMSILSERSSLSARLELGQKHLFATPSFMLLIVA